MNICKRSLLDWRTTAGFGFHTYGTTRVLLLGKLCIHLWKVSYDG